MRRIARFLSVSLALCLPLSALALPVGPNDSVQGSVTVSAFNLTTHPITHVAGTLKFNASDALDTGEGILVRVYNAENVEVGTGQYTNNLSQPILTCACISIDLAAAVNANPMRVVVESLAGTMELTQLAVVVHNAPGADRKRAAVVPTLEAVTDGEYPGIDWELPPTDIGSYLLYKGYFPNVAPFLPQNHTVPDNVATGNVPGRFPVAYEVYEFAAANSNNMNLEAFFHADGGTISCESYGASISQTTIQVRNCTDEYPGRSGPNAHSIHGLSWWTYWGGIAGHPEYAGTTMSERLAESLIEVGERHADLIDEGAGITLTGGSYGGQGSIAQSMLVPRIQNQISVVHATRTWTLLAENIVDPAINLAWGNQSRNAVNFRVQAPTGKLDHIFYRIDGSPSDSITPLQRDFFNICNANKIACLGTWHNDTGHSFNEPGVTIPQARFPDPNMKVRLDRPLVVFTDSTGNSMAIRGYYNLGLSWNTAGIVQTPESLTIPLKYLAYKNMTTDPINKPVADQPDNITATVTIRRSVVFGMDPGATIAWQFGAQSGQVTADAKGEVTIPGLQFATSASVYTPLVLTRAASLDGLVYTRAPRPNVPFSISSIQVADGAIWPSATDVKRINSNIPESDVIWRTSQGSITVLHDCTTVPAICTAQEARVSPDGRKVVYSVGIGNSLQTLPGPNSFQIQELLSSSLWVYNLETGTKAPIPNTPPGTIDRQPDWIDNDTIVFTSNRAHKYPFKGIYDLHAGRNQFNQPRWFSTAFSVSQEQPYSAPAGQSLHLYRMDIDGTNVKNLTPHENWALRPTVLKNGDIVYSCWQAHAQKGFDQGASVTPGTMANKWWICRVNQHGGDETVLLHAHKSPNLKTTAWLPPYITGGEGEDQLRAMRSIGEDENGFLYVTNYYRANHRGLGIIYKWKNVNPSVEGCSAANCMTYGLSNSATPGSASYTPSTLEAWTPYGNAQDADPRRYNDPATPGVNENKVVGKAGYMNLLPGGEKMITHARGLCYNGSILYTQLNMAFTGGEPTCDSGIYKAKAARITNPFDTAQLEVMVDDPNYFEWDSASVSTYQSRYGQATPTQQPDYTPGACYLQVVDARMAELALRAPYNWATTVTYLCGNQGCAVNPENTGFHAANMAGLTVHTVDLWNKSYSGGSANQDAFGGSMSNQGHMGTTLLGTQPLLADGSVKMRVPCETPLLMSGTDADGMAIAHDDMLHSLRSGETRTCHGCHDGHSEERFTALGQQTAEARMVGRMAYNTNPPMPSTNEKLSFLADIAPILETRCSGCHTEMVASDPLLYSKIAWDRTQFDWPWASLKLGSARTGTAIRNVRIVNGGTGYAVNAPLVFASNGGNPNVAAGYVSAIGAGGTITKITLTSPGAGYPAGVSAVTAAGGSGAVLQAMTDDYILHRPYTSKWVAKFARDSLLYWKCMGARQDGRTDGQYANDIDFGAAHSGPGHTVTTAECLKIGRWIDGGIYHWQDPTP